MEEAYQKDSSFSFVGTPEEIDVEQEINDTATGMAYDPYRLAEVLVKIGQQMMGVKLYSYQEKPAFRIIYSILARDGAEITMLYARQSGKSETSTFCIVTLGVLLPVLAKIFPQELGHFSRGVKMGLLAPQGEQVQTIYARCMERLLSEPVRMFLDDPDILDQPLSTVHFKLKSGSFLTGQSAAKQSKIESKTYHIIFLDEAQDIDTEKVRKCVAWDSEVVLEDGTKCTMEEAFLSGSILYGHEGKITPKEYLDNGVQEVIKVELTNQFSIEATANHKHKVIRRGKNDNKPIFLTTEELTISDRLCVADKIDAFGDIGTYEEGLLTGYMLGDGYSKNSKTLFCGFLPTIRRITDLVKQFDCNVLVRNKQEKSSLYEIAIIGTSKKESGFRTNSKGSNGFIEYLKSIDCYGFTGEDKHIPKKAFSREYYVGLVEGLIETDGSVFVSSNKGHINFSGISEELVKGFQFVCQKFGVHGNILVKNNSGGFAENSKPIWSFTIKDTRSILAFAENFSLYEKQKKLEAVIEIARTKSDRNTCLLYPSSERYYKIKSIQNVGKKQTYCIVSDRDDHLWTVNGIVTHNSIIPMTASTFGTIVRTGTPSRNKGDFYYTTKNNEKHDAKLKSPKEKEKKQLHFQYDYLEVIKSKKDMFKYDKQDFHLLYEKSVMRDKKSWGENSDIFRLAYKVEWILEVGMFITEKGLEEQCFDKRMTLPTIDVKTDFVVAGLDIASARNSTVLTTATIDAPAGDFGERPKKTIADWLVLTGINYEEQFQVLAEELIQKRVQVLFADYTGVGRALTDVLIHHLSEYMVIVPYTFTPSSKSDMWKALDEDIMNRRLVVPAHKSVQSKKEFKTFTEQMTNLQKYWRGSFMVCEKTTGYEDDYCDSLALMNLAGNHLYTPPSEVEITENHLMGTAHRNSMVQRSRW